MRDEERIDSVKRTHQELYGKCNDITIAYAPGRAEILGSHTDYNHGFTLSTNISRNLLIAASPRDDHVIRIASPSMGRETYIIDPTSVESLETAKSDRTSKSSWTNYVKGMLWSYASRGVALQGFDATIDSTIPPGAGLSSSAALETALSRLIVHENELPYTAKQQAILAKEAENIYVGAPCGYLDQATVGLADGWLFMNHKPSNDSEFSYETLPASLFDDYTFVVGYDPASRHTIAEGKYAARKHTLQKTLNSLMIATGKYIEGVGEISSKELMESLPYLTTMINRRALPLITHVVYENERVKRAARYLKLGHLAAFGEVMNQSGESALDLYRLDEDAPELRYVYETVSARPEQYGVRGIRNMGGGFNATTIALVDTDAVQTYKQRLHFSYKQKYGRDYQFVPVTQAPAAQIID